MTFQPVLPWAILAVVIAALVLARAVALRLVLSVSYGTRRSAMLRWSAVTLAVLLILAATTRPGIRGEETHRGPGAAGANLNVFLVVDRSVDSSVTGMHNDMAALIDQYPAARYALITFSSRASLDWPLSQDVWSLRPTIAALGSVPTPDGQGVAAGAARNVLRYQLLQAAQQYPGSRNVVLYFGSGGTPAAQADFDLARGLVDGGLVLGYGRSAAIDETKLRQLAAQLGVLYEHREPGQPFRPTLPQTGIRPAAVDRIELYWLLTMLAAVLLLGEIYLSVRDFRRSRIARRDVSW